MGHNDLNDMISENFDVAFEKYTSIERDVYDVAYNNPNDTLITETRRFDAVELLRTIRARE